MPGYAAPPLSPDLGAAVLIGFGWRLSRSISCVAFTCKLLPPRRRLLALGAAPRPFRSASPFRPSASRWIDNFGCRRQLMVSHPDPLILSCRIVAACHRARDAVNVPAADQQRSHRAG